ncbi:Fungal Zn(2)-Cys(6) binuclear cluster domain [Rhizoctonia solani]|uniref:Fungal Zn(2)-Cys(6) binuclear cluster domain n=1 Tax=Rhizoctonia solani TaxID=456999 RepID=A0A8H8SYH4_9AGAM|nr:Fungal Zn(2)-Cys(6) binuclear cluster domain [Rhizoctonia solani]QRW21567.1 Fungal Zn(2)-Cys(6) binuclear cluster domain [Rhizoctonia solani]
MSLSPSSTTTSEPSHAKRKRAMSYTSNNGSDSHQYGGLPMHQGHPSTNGHYPPQPQQVPGTATPQAHMPTSIPKRGARACTACRKGKNRCEGESPCRRCQMSGTPCVFEKPEKKNQVNGNANGAAERVSRLEGQYLMMQSQMIGMQSSLDRILSAIQSQNAAQVYPHSAIPPTPQSASTHPSMSESPREGVAFTPQPVVPSSSRDGYYDDDRSPPRKKWPALPGFAPPPHKFATYGIVPSTAPSSEDESEDTLPRSALNAPIEALQGLANAAVEAATGPGLSPRRDAYNRVKKRKRVEPIPRNAFPNVLEKGLVREDEARELYNMWGFFSGCHLFIPLFDPAYDTFESLRDRTPFCFDAILAVAAKIRVGNGQPGATFHRCLEEAQGIARSTLFGPVVRKEAVQAMLLLSAWSTNGWLPSGHAMRMALDLGLHRALEKLADGPSEGKRSEAEERDLVVSARIWLCLYWFDHQMSLGTGHPIILRDESSIRHCRLLLSHPMASPTDVRLVSQIELIIQKTQIYETLSPLNGQVNHSTLAFIRRANIALDKWWADCDELHRPTMDEDSLLRKILSGELYYAKLWLVCVALRGVSWDKMPFEQRELAFQAKEAASNCLATFLNSPAYRAALRYAVHDSLVTAAFSGLFLLKVANLFPGEVDLAGIVVQVDQLANLLSEVAAERYALTLRVMLTNLRRKIGLTTPALQPGDGIDVSAVTSATPGVTGFDPTAPTSATGLTGMGILDDMAFSWPADSMFSPSNIPLWLQEASLTDLGLPINGSDGVFLPFGPGWTGLGEMGMPEAW